MTTFAADLLEWRTRMGLQRPGAAAWLGVPYRLIEEWEGGRSEPPPASSVRRLLETAVTTGRRVNGR